MKIYDHTKSLDKLRYMQTGFLCFTTVSDLNSFFRLFTQTNAISNDFFFVFVFTEFMEVMTGES